MKIKLSTMEIDKAYHTLYENQKRNYSRWHDFREVGVDEGYYDWYYAEEGLVVLRDRISEGLYLIKARSPQDALVKLKEREVSEHD